MTIPLRLLIAMDSEDDALLAVSELQRAGYNPRWDRVSLAKAFAEKLDEGHWELVILDYAMPGFGGLEAMAMARQKDPDLPVILLSRGIGEEAAVEAIKAGASDCILTDRLDRLPAAVGRELRDAELRRSRRAAEASARRAFEERARLYRLLTENANDVIWSCDLDMTFQYVSPAVEKLLGWTPDEVIEAGVKMTLPPESFRLAAAKIQAVLDQHRSGSRSEPVIFEIEQNRKDGTRVWVEVSASPFFDDKGRIAGISGVTRDISERKKTENALLRAKQEWERTFDSVPDLITIIDNQYRILHANRAMAQRLGLTTEECVGKVCYESVHGVSAVPACCPHALSLADGQEHSTEVHEERLGGDLLISCTPFFDEQGGRVGSVLVARDITERKRAMEAARHAHERLQCFVDANIMGVVVATPSGRIIDTNDYYLRIIGYTREEFEKGTVDWRAITPPEWLSADERAIEELRERGTCTPYEKEYVRRNGTRVSVILFDAMLPGPEEQIAAFVLDITDRKRAENALRESERRYSDMLGKVELISMMLDRDARVTFCNDYLLRLTGWRREEVLGADWFELFIPPGSDELKHTFMELLNDLPSAWYHENEILTRSGGRRRIRWSNSVLRSASGDVVGTASIGEDITERTRAENALRESEERFRMVVESAPDAIFVRSESGHYLYLNHAAISLFGAESADQLIGRHISEHIPPDEYASLTERIERLNAGQAVPVIEQTFLRMDGSTVTVEVSAVPLRYSGVNGALIFARDISKRKEAEKALRESERRYRSLFENMLSGYAYCKMLFDDGSPHDFTYIEVNGAFEKLTGLMNVVGKKVSDVIPGIRESNPELLQIYGRVAQTGTPERFETYVEPLGQWFSVSVYSPEKECFIAVFDDITDRKAAQEALLEAHNRLDQIIEYLPDATFVIDSDRKVIAWNNAIEQMTGISRKEIIGRGNYEYSMPFYGERRPIIIDLALLPNEEFEKRKYGAIHRLADAVYGESYVPRTHGGVGAYLSATASKLRDASGNVIGAIETIRDITDQKKAEQALKESLAKREELEAIIGQSPIIVVLYHMEKGFPIEYVSESIAQYGYMPEDFTSGMMGILDIIHPDDVDKIIAEAQMHLRMGCDDITQDYRIRTAWGNYQWVLNRTRMRRDRDGRVTHGQSIIHDITDRKQVEMALQESGRHMRALLDNIPDIVWLKDRESRYIAVNEPFGKTCGFKPEEIIGKTDLDIWPKDLAENYRVDDADVIQSGRAKRVEEFLEDAAGKRNWIETVKTPIRNDRGDVIGTTGIARDITERKSVEDLYRMLSDKSLAGVYVVQEGVFKYINTNAASYAGYTAEELVGRRSTFLVHPEDGHIARKYSSELLRGIRQTPYEFRIIDKAGRIRWILETVTTITYEGKPAILGNSMDISQLKEAQQKLEELQALESSVLSAIPHAVLGLENRRIVFANDNVETVFGWKPAEIIGGDLAVLFSSETSCEAVTRRIVTALQNEKVYSLEPEHPLVHRDGHAQDCRVTAARIGSGSGEGLVATFEDVTDRKRAQLQILQSEKMASIGQLAAGVAHEINNPTGYVSSNLKTLSEYFEDVMGVLLRYRALLSGVREEIEKAKLDGNLAGLARDIEAMEQKVDIDYILKDAPSLIHESREGTERIKEIVLSLKNFAHPGEERFSYSDVNKNLDSTLNVVWNELKYKTTVRKEYGELPEVECHPQQINQVFMNMLVNAAQAIKVRGEIAIRTRSLGNVVEISISDTGVGIPEENLARIFDPFFTTKEVGKGTGLGLNVAYNIVKKHHGAIDVASKVGEGTTFTIRLPVHQEEGRA